MSLGINNLRKGYRGLCIIDGVLARVSSFDVNVNQNVEFYDHTLGLNDKLTSASSSAPAGSKEDSVPKINVQKYFWRPGVKITSGNISLYPDVSVLNKLFNLTKYGKIFNITYYYSCGVGRVIKECRINSFQFDIQAGDIVNLTIEIMAKESREFFGDPPYNSKAEKLIPFSAVNINTKHLGANIMSFSLTVNNSCIPIYTAGSLDPKKIRTGMQMVSGSISYYWDGSNPTLSSTIVDELTKPSEIKINISDICSSSFSETLCVVYNPTTMKGGVDVISQVLAFNGVGYALGK